MTIENEQQIERLQTANIILYGEELNHYLEAPSVLEDLADYSEAIFVGYKRCGRCKKLKKLHLFNQNSSSKLNCTGNCKDCQKETAQVSYDKNKGNRDYKKYYAENKDMKRQHNRTYYEQHKDQLSVKHQKYRKTADGRKAMNQAHAIRKKGMKQNTGIPYTREMVIDRDSQFINEIFPICCLCGKAIEDCDTLHMEHLIPIVIGGADCFTNVGCAHSECNLRKSKDAHELTVAQVESVEKRAEQYINAHPEHFPDFA